MLNEEHFFDTRIHKPKEGQIMARYVAMADLIKGPDKQRLIELLCGDQVIAASQMMRKQLFRIKANARS